MTNPLDQLALAALLHAFGGEIRRLEDDWTARNAFFGGERLRIPLPVRTNPFDPGPDRLNRHLTWAFVSWLGRGALPTHRAGE